MSDTAITTEHKIVELSTLKSNRKLRKAIMRLQVAGGLFYWSHCSQHLAYDLYIGVRVSGPADAVDAFFSAIGI